MARSFNGSSDAGSVAIDLSGYVNLSISFWGNNRANSSNDKMFMEYTANSSGVTNSGGFFLDPNSGGFAGNVEAFIRTTSDLNLFADKTFAQPAVGYHHWAFLFNLNNPLTGAGKLAGLYVDGVAQTTTDHTNTGLGGNFANSTLYLASRGGSSLFGAVDMADLALFGGTRNLTALEVKALASGVRPPRVGQDLTLMYWPMAGLVAAEPNVSGHGSNLTLTGTSAVIGPPFGGSGVA